jgi:hypothetical protein
MHNHLLDSTDRHSGNWTNQINRIETKTKRTTQQYLWTGRMQRTLYVEDAETAVKIITRARDDARIRLQSPMTMER